MKEHTIEDISKRLSSILNDGRFKSRIGTANNNWLEMTIEDVIESILNYFGGLVKIVLWVHYKHLATNYCLTD